MESRPHPSSGMSFTPVKAETCPLGSLWVSLGGKLLCSHLLWFLNRRKICEWAWELVDAGPVLCRSAWPLGLPPSPHPSKEGWKWRNVM